MITVAGYTMSDINTAIGLAGVNGSVFFPNGVYAIDGLAASVANQTWILERAAVLRRTNSATSFHALQITAAGFKMVGGTIDGNSANNTVANSSGIYGNYDFEFTDVTIQDCTGYGFQLWDNVVKLTNCRVKNTLNPCIIWQVITGPGTIAPHIRQCTFDRSMLNPTTINLSNVLIQSTRTTAEFAINPIIDQCRFVLPFTNKDAVLGMELLYCQRGMVTNNIFIGGEMGVSLAQTGFTTVLGNIFQIQQTYAIEVGGHDNIIAGNAGTGHGPSLYGVELNPVARDIVVANNIMKGYSIAYHYGAGSTYVATGNI